MLTITMSENIVTATVVIETKCIKICEYIGVCYVKRLVFTIIKCSSAVLGELKNERIGVSTQVTKS